MNDCDRTREARDKLIGWCLAMAVILRGSRYEKRSRILRDVEIAADLLQKVADVLAFSDDKQSN